jgi:5'-methylthioadenosine phosphorylase
MHRQWGGDLIGMTCMPEAKLAREAQMCYALIALPTDYDCWRPHDAGRMHGDLLKEILGNLRQSTDHAVALIRETLKLIPTHERRCGCHDSLALAVWSDRRAIDETSRERLGVLDPSGRLRVP